MQMIANGTSLGIGRVYTAIGLWGGAALPPAPLAVSAAISSLGALAYASDGGTTSNGIPYLGALFSPRVAMTAGDVVRELGKLGANGGSVCLTGAEPDVATLQDIATYAAAGQIQPALSAWSEQTAGAIRAAADSATQVSRLAQWVAENWVLVAVAAVAVWAFATGKIKV